MKTLLEALVCSGGQSILRHARRNNSRKKNKEILTGLREKEKVSFKRTIHMKFYPGRFFGPQKEDYSGHSLHPEGKLEFLISTAQQNIKQIILNFPVATLKSKKG